MNSRIALRFGLLCLLLPLLSGFLGCKHLRVADRWFDSDRISEVPAEILPIWTDTVLHQPGKPGIRGFGGRVYFYETGKPDPVQVDGQLVVYAFDGDSKDPTKVAPLRKYVITSEQLAGHHSSSSLGHSYSVWVPWDRVGGEGRSLSLVVRFDGRNGGTTLSKPARMLLPGVEATLEPMELESGSGIQLATHEVEDKLGKAKLEKEKLGFETSSIDLPPSFQRRVLGASSPVAESVPDSVSVWDRRTYGSTTWEQKPLAESAPFRSAHLQPKSQTESAAVTPHWRSLEKSESEASHSRLRRTTRSAQQRLQARRKLGAPQAPAAAGPQPSLEELQFAPPMQLESDSTPRSNRDSQAPAAAGFQPETTRN